MRARARGVFVRRLKLGAVLLMFTVQGAVLSAQAAVVDEGVVHLNWAPAPGEVIQYGIFTNREGGVPGSDPELVVSGESADVELRFGEQLVVRVAAFYAGDLRGPYSPMSEVFELRGASDAEFDFNGDGRSDALWRDTASDQPQLWLMEASGPSNTAPIDAPPPGAEFAGAVDFDQDGLSDLAWTDPSDGSLVVWFMDGSRLIDDWTVTRRGSGWKARVLGDLSPEGFARVAWVSEGGGSVEVWEVNGRNIDDAVMNSQVVFNFQDPELRWMLERGCDLNGDGVREIIWRHRGAQPGTVAGYAATFFGEAGAHRTVGIDLGGAIVRGCGDFKQPEGQGLLCEDPSGRPGIWHLTGQKGLWSTGEVTLLPEVNGLSLEGFGDFDGDGDTDLLFIAAEDARGEVVELDGLVRESSDSFSFPAAKLVSYDDPLPAPDDRN